MGAAATMNMIMMIVLMAINFASIAYADTGYATFYTQYVPSACYGNEGKEVMIGAASDAFWNNGAACGKGSVTVEIVDHCPAGCSGTIDLSQEAFAKIADPVVGKVQVEFHQA